MLSLRNQLTSQLNLLSPLKNKPSFGVKTDMEYKYEWPSLMQSPGKGLLKKSQTADEFALNMDTGMYNAIYEQVEE
jgi:hypothetical protein